MKTFTKMHALGNDFMVINNLNLDFPLNKITLWGDRHLGVGFDQALLIEPSKHADFFCRILNADGSEAEQCGNGLRCVALYLKTKNLHEKSTLSIETRAGVFPIRFCDDGEIEVTMGPPQSDIESLTLSLAGTDYALKTISMGNPHCILKVETLDKTPIEPLGRALNQHPHFPLGVNAGFMQVVHPHLAKLATFERGAGLTLACGSNACAAAVIGILEGNLQSPAQIAFQHGNLTITFEGGNAPIYMKGPACLVFEGRFLTD